MQSSNNPKGILEQEFFMGKDDKEVKKKMDDRMEQLEGVGHTNFKREKIGRNQGCPCGSGKKWKNCCISKAR